MDKDRMVQKLSGTSRNNYVIYVCVCACVRVCEFEDLLKIILLCDCVMGKFLKLSCFSFLTCKIGSSNVT
jgi:hypothetical protein